MEGTQGSAWGDRRLLYPCQFPPTGEFPDLPDEYRMTFPWFVAPATGVGINHTESVPDAVTGQTGLSEALFRVFVAQIGGPNPALPATLRIASLCGNDVLTGESDVVLGDVTTVKQPLLHFGPCEVQTFRLTANGVESNLPAVFGTGGLFAVDSNQPPGDVPDIATWGELVEYARQLVPHQPPAMDVLETLAGAGPGSLDPGCFAFLGLTEPVTIPDAGPCAADGRTRLTFLGVPGAPGGLLFTVGALGDATGVSDPGAADDGSLDAWRPLFRESVFPCGFGQVGHTVCSADDAGDPVGAFTVASMQFAGGLPIEPGDDAPLVTVTATATGRSWTLAPAGGQWELDSDSATAARVIIRNGSVTFAVPLGESGGEGFTYSIEQGDADPVTGTIPLTGVLHTPAVGREGTTPPPSTTVLEAKESLAEFLGQLSASIDAGDAGFSFDRLDPAVIDQYGADACRTFLRKPKPGFTIEFASLGELGHYDWPLEDGSGTVPVDNVQYIEATVTDGGVSKQQTAHFSVIDGRYHWFTYC